VRGRDAALPARDRAGRIHLCDQLLVPLALTAGGEFRAVGWSPHADAQRILLRAWFERDVIVTRGGDGDGVHIAVPAMEAV
jgi:hypothetical protein